MTELPPSSRGSLQTNTAVIAVVGGAVLCCIVVAVIVTPSLPFSDDYKRAYRREARSNLKAAFAAEMGHFAVKQTFEVAIDRVGFAPARGNRYLYAFSSEGDLLEPGKRASGHVGVKPDPASVPGADIAAIEAGIPDALWDEVGITGTCPDCSITIVAAGNFDDDDTIDVWSVSTKDRIISGTRVPSGMPWQHVNDVDK